MRSEFLYSKYKLTWGVPTFDISKVASVRALLSVASTGSVSSLLKSIYGLNRAIVTNIVHSVEEEPNVDIPSSWTPIFKHVVWENYRDPLVNGVASVADVKQWIGDIVTFLDSVKEEDAPFLKLGNYIEASISAPEQLKTLWRDLCNTLHYQGVDPKKGLAPYLVSQFIETQAESIIRGGDLYLTYYFLSQWVGEDDTLARLAAPKLEIMEIFWESAWHPSNTYTQRDILSQIWKQCFGLVEAFFLQYNLPELLVGIPLEASARVLQSYPTAHYPSLMSALQHISAFIASSYATLLEAQCDVFNQSMPPTIVSFTDLRDYLIQSFSVVWSPNVTNLVQQAINNYTSPRTVLSFKRSPERYSTLMKELYIYIQEYSVVGGADRLFDRKLLFSMLYSIGSSYVGTNQQWKEMIKFCITCAWWDASDSEKTSLANSIFSDYLQPYLSSETITPYWNPSWTPIVVNVVSSRLQNLRRRLLPTGFPLTTLLEHYTSCLTLWESYKSWPRVLVDSYLGTLYEELAASLRDTLSKHLIGSASEVARQIVDTYLGEHSDVHLSGPDKLELYKIVSVGITSRTDWVTIITPYVERPTLYAVLKALTNEVEQAAQEYSQQSIEVIVSSVLDLLRWYLKDVDLLTPLKSYLDSRFTSLKNKRLISHDDPLDGRALRDYIQELNNVVSNGYAHLNTVLEPTIEEVVNTTTVANTLPPTLTIPDRERLDSDLAEVRTRVNQTVSSPSVASANIHPHLSFYTTSTPWQQFGALYSMEAWSQSLHNDVVSTVGSVLGTLSGLTNGIAATIGNITSTVSNLLSVVTTPIFGALSALQQVTAMFQSIANSLNAMVSHLNSLAAMPGYIASQIQQSIAAIQNAVNSILSTPGQVAQAVTNVVNSIQNVLNPVSTDGGSEDLVKFEKASDVEICKEG